MAIHVLKIGGMTCNHCVQAVTDSLRTTPGVRSAEVDLQSATARVDHDDQSSSIGDITAAVKRAGYQVEGFEQIEEDLPIRRGSIASR